MPAFPTNYKVLFLQGGASLQFSMVPMNLLTPGATADYIVTGDWGKKALKEAKKVGATNVAATTETGNFKRIPRAGRDSADARRGLRALHVEQHDPWHRVAVRAELSGDAPLVCDMSSDMYSRPLDVSKYGVIYSGAQKNLGPSGVTVVIMRDDLLARSAESLPTMLNYRVQAENGSLYNTPPVFGIYILRLVLKWLVANGGLPAIQKINERKAGVLYAELDRIGVLDAARRRRTAARCMNVTFRLPTEDLERLFVKESTAAGFDGLKGHRSVGGLRASIYNAFPEQGIHDLVAFMREFEKRHG